MYYRNLLEKTRNINKILLETAGLPVEFVELAEILKDVIEAKVFITNRDGKLLGYALMDQFECEVMKEVVLERDSFPENYNAWLLSLNETSCFELKQKQNKCAYIDNKECLYTKRATVVVPIVSGGKRLGSLIIFRFEEDFNDEDLILAEKGATVLGIEMLRAKTKEIEKAAQNKAAAQLALGTLTCSELETVRHAFKEINGNEGILVAGKIADRLGFTGGVIVQALRKLEVASLIKRKSRGTKGTYIKVLNEHLLNELKKNT